jgi:UDP-N-acetylglucosamine 2-epimerase (non-hydrolysing)
VERRTTILLFFVLGTRPEIIKLAPIMHECDRRGVEYFVLHTGQHYSEGMSGSFFHDMELRDPDRNLNIGSGSHGEQTAKALVGIERELNGVNPDVVVVQGDTNAVLSAALAAAKLRIPIAHVEAGLRSYDQRMPEELNRRLTDHSSDYLFAPTRASARILRKENVWGKVFVTGNTVIDAIEMSLPKAKRTRSIAQELGVKDFLLLTMHRAENVDDRATLEGLVRGLLSLDRQILFAVHPRTKERLTQFGLIESISSSGSIVMIEPPGYLEFLALLETCSFVLADSGGIQEEVTAPSINKRAFVLRTSTERPEAVESGHAIVVGVDPSQFPYRVRDGMETWSVEDRECPYGSGKAARRIISILRKGVEKQK